jgi:transcriptional regulator with AAA-type ATPase domain
VPPLRVRPSDIPNLAAYFLRQYCLEHRSQPIVPTSEALRTLETSPFPGNIKELQAVLERAAGNMQDDETQLTADVLWDTTKVRILFPGVAQVLRSWHRRDSQLLVASYLSEVQVSDL